MDLSVGQIAERCGVNVSAIHFYERKGLIHSSRSTGNQRRFGREAIRRVSIIKVAQQLGISLEEVAEVFEPLPKFGAPSKADWQSVAEQWQQRLQQRIAKLQRLKDSLTGCIGCGCLSMTACPLYNADDKLAQQGPGPVILERS
ncbi:redox-sensitive transcriptional activator SoxR [Pseudidiomarina homiensis]|uniref:Redox-sensitive transcriptional activator SoxR n=1 Tax=Pseudidiomarina homiensis TaxID=364198 RepID=A0A432Y4X0_9GAMM|nr:redox-sensitive transcriptional activator SoxR [Pseudidiomarina homiensis]RUO55941.1 redox-sensitive transcriptional activator SoxR [Pseudidiomarina homiensis]